MTRDADLERIVANLTRPIPAPRRPEPIPQQSWATLKVGDRLRSTAAVPPYAAGTLFAVESCDSLGVTLAPRYRLEDRDWRERFTKERRPRKKSPRKTKKPLDDRAGGV